jgi:hypothetical protein
MITATSPSAWAQDKPVPGVSDQEKAGKHSADWIEARITALHDKLHITSAQEKAWNDVAQQMRDNTKEMKGLIDNWNSVAGKLDALDSLKKHAEMVEAHSKALQKLIPAFEALFNQMSEKQKADADVVFSGHEGRKHRKSE